MINKMDVITMENENYVVASTVSISGISYAYLVNVQDTKKVMFARIDNDNSLSEIRDPDVIETLIPYLLENGKDILEPSN